MEKLSQHKPSITNLFEQQSKMAQSQRELEPQTKAFEALNIYPIFENVCKYLAPRDIFKLKRTSKSFAPMFKSLFNSAWNINRFLSRFTPDPVGLRSIMARHGALIAEGAALQFFDRSTWETAQLDLYVEKNVGKEKDCTGVLQVREFFRKHGYKPVIEISHRTLVHIESWIKLDDNNRELKVKVMGTYGHPLTAILGGLYMTTLTNIITWDAAYSVYPDAIFTGENKSYNINGGPICKSDDTYVCDMYARHGWPLVYISHRKYLTFGSFQETFRTFNDSYTWKVNLNTDNVEPGVPASDLEKTYFRTPWVDERPKVTIVPVDKLCCTLFGVAQGKRMPLMFSPLDQ